MSQANYSVETTVSSGIKIVTGRVSVAANIATPLSGSRFTLDPAGFNVSGVIKIRLDDSYSQLLFASASSIDSTGDYDNYFRVYDEALPIVRIACHDANGNDVQPGTTEFSFLLVLAE